MLCVIVSPCHRVQIYLVLASLSAKMKRYYSISTFFSSPQETVQSQDNFVNEVAVSVSEITIPQYR